MGPTQPVTPGEAERHGTRRGSGILAAMPAQPRQARSLLPGLRGPLGLAGLPALIVLAAGFTDAPGGVAVQADDTDRDGVPDDVELGGIESEPLLEFPVYGADPDQPDIFVQVDWIACDPIVEYCGPNNSLDRNRMTSAAVEEMATYFAPDVAVHVDNGVPPPRPELATLHGAWGGARRVPGAQGCKAALGPRFGYFHRGSVAGIYGGGGGDLYGFCFGANSSRGSVTAHELGHNFGLDHGGNQPSFPANCKPHYRSPMSYGYLYDPTLAQFSRGTHGMVLNATAMDEQLGVGTTDPELLAALREPPWYFEVRDDGAVDWNRDGRFDEQPVRAALTWAWSSCDQSTPHADFFNPGREPSMVWLPAADRPRLYLFTRSPEDGRPGYRVATRFDLCTINDLTDEHVPCTDWTPGLEAHQPIPDTPSGIGAVAPVAWQDGATGHLLAVWADAAGQLHQQTLTHEGGNERWGAPAPIPGARTDRSPALLLLPGDQTMLLVAPETRRLRVRERPLGDATWSAPVDATWEDGTAIDACHAPALARGFERGRAGEAVYAAIPTGRFCELEIGRRNPDGTWARLTSQVWPGAVPFSGGRPGLAYVPFRPEVPEEGRFYVAWKPLPTGAGLIGFTQGNDPAPEATALRMQFQGGTYLRNLWAVTTDGIPLLYDVRFDDNLRAAYVHANRNLQFLPFADGVIDADMYDQDDYEYILANLACSLTGSCDP
jgi:hypothetical protein